MYDVIIVGARVAGSPVALRLARAGHRVLLLDRGGFPSDRLSSHFLWPRGTSYLNRLGVLDEVLSQTPSDTVLDVRVEGVRLQGEVPLPLLRERFTRVHGDADGVVQTYASVRRTVLDTVLVQAAVAAGAELREHVTVEELVVEDGVVVGVRGHDRAGAPVTERARVVVGADGRRSSVARLLGLADKDRRPKCSFAQYTYWAGLGLDRGRLVRTGRLGLAVMPTNDDLTMALVYGPSEWYADFRSDPQGNYQRILEATDPELAALVRDRGVQAERFAHTADQAAYTRRPSGPGWLLTGDAVSFKDQCTAMGITHALRDAELAADCLERGLGGELPLGEALEEYARRRYLDAADYYNFVATQAEMNPTRMDEIELLEAVRDDPAETGNYLAVFGDTLPVRRFTSRSNLRRLLRGRPATPAGSYRRHEAELDGTFANPFLLNGSGANGHGADGATGHGADGATGAATEDLKSLYAMSRTAFHFARPVGPDVLARTQEYGAWVAAREERGVWPFTRYLSGLPGPTADQVDDLGRPSVGVNFASQDYLSLASHPAVHAAAVAAIEAYGPHSAGSPMGLGNTLLSQHLEHELGDLLGMEHVLLFPTGWAAGFGVISGLLQPDDTVLLDKLSHNCLSVGARASGAHVERYEHNDLDALRRRLKATRDRDTRCGVLVVTEGLFSMDSDIPDLRATQDICREYGATLLVDVAHDLGATGPGGTGQLGAQGLLGDVDLVLGSFSKTFTSNGGFMATGSAAVKQYVKHFAGSHAYSNGLSPAQAAAVRTSLSIVRSAEGDRLRGELATVVDALRGGLQRRGVHPLGAPSAIVPVVIGEETRARLAHRMLYSRGVGANQVEYPIVESGLARFRLQAQAGHTLEQAEHAAEVVADVLESVLEQVPLTRAEESPVRRSRKRAAAVA